MAARKKSGATAGGDTPIEALLHAKETRKNIPTIEQEELVSDEEGTPERPTWRVGLWR